MKRTRDSNRVKFFSKNDLTVGFNLQRAEKILRNSASSTSSDINDILELYNIKKYIDNKLYLNSWKPEDVNDFQKRVSEFGKTVGIHMSEVGDNNVLDIYKGILLDYVDTFWELVNNFGVFEKISNKKFSILLSIEPNRISNILEHKKLVEKYDNELRDFLSGYPRAAEILITAYELPEDSSMRKKFIPKTLTVSDKEDIIMKYIDSDKANLNYLQVIERIRNSKAFLNPNWDLFIQLKTHLIRKGLRNLTKIQTSF